MIEQELINIWKYSSKQEQVKFDKSKLLIDLQTNLDKIEKSLKSRDRRELIPAIVMIPVFGFIAFFIPFILSKIGAALIVLWCIYLIIRIKNLKKYKPIVPSETYLNYLYKTREYFLIQKKMLDTSLYWYILPCLTGVLLFLIGFNMSYERLTVNIIGTIGLGAIIYIMNKRAVKKEFDPVINKIDEIINVLNE